MRKLNIIVIISAIVVMMLGFSAYSAEAQTKRALLVGVSDYGNAMEDPNKWANISGANDIALLTPLFTGQGYSVTSLVDGQATHAGITGALEQLATDSQKGDIVYIHFSMHGQPFEDLNGDEEDGWDEALIPVDAEVLYAEGVYEGKNHLLDDELEGYFNQIRNKLGSNGQLVVVLDACHSGTGVRGDEDHIRGTREGFTRSGKDYTPDRTQETNDYFTIASLENQSPIIVLEACRSYQNNKEVRGDDGNYYGAVTFAVAETMKEYPIDADGLWIKKVKEVFAEKLKKRIRRNMQNLVIEKSE